MTPQRAAVLEALRASADHPTAGDLHGRVRRRLPGIGMATVYRTLELLRDHGEILELQLGDVPVARYDANTGAHQHVLCTDCGAVADVDVTLPPEVLRQAERLSGFDVRSHDLQLQGRCPACRRSGA